MQFVWICVITYHNILEIKMKEIKTKTMYINWKEMVLAHDITSTSYFDILTYDLSKFLEIIKALCY